VRREPLSLKLHELVLTVLGYEFPDLTDYWDGNWLVCSAVIEANNASVVSQGSFLRTDELRRFRDEIAALHATLSGKAELVPMEPNLKILLQPFGTGQISVDVEITPDHLCQFHRFEFGIDQSYLPETLVSLDAILAAYPVRGTP
jgi:hypothetical protein